MGCPRSATSYSAGAAAGSRSPEEALVDPSPAPVDRGGPRSLARRPDLALAGADGASAPICCRGSAVMTSGELATVIAGTREGWPGRFEVRDQGVDRRRAIRAIAYVSSIGSEPLYSAGAPFDGQRSPRPKVMASKGRMRTGASSCAVAISTHSPSRSSKASRVRSAGSTSHR